jgi:signal transduction histidine kinase
MGELASAFNSLLDRVEQAFNMQKLFIDNASHEIRNPLTAIMGETELALQRPRSGTEYVDSLTAISREADRLNTLVNDLLQLAGISPKDIAVSRENLPVIELLRAAKEKLNLQSPENQVALDSLDQIPESNIHLEGNRHLLTTAFFNLMDNASKYSSYKPVAVSLS